MPRPSKQASRFISRSLRAPRAEAEGGCRHAKIAATLVERHTRYVMLTKVAGKDTQTSSPRS